MEKKGERETEREEERRKKERQKSSLKRFMNSVCWSNRPQRHRLGRLKKAERIFSRMQATHTEVGKVCENPAYFNLKPDHD